ncbi:FUSC family protein, partial [Streptomyces sp. NPDC059385]|uniref:FUSC family protein n=1 Tax=Streptomyces sp. NPDC059385 TaxID=3346817 RepID=UPI00367B350B
MSGLVAVPYVFTPGSRLRSAARLVLCAAVSWYLCLWWGTSTTPVPAALPAVLILREDVYAWPRMGWERLAGVVVGVVLSTVLLHWVTDPAWSFPLVLLCGCAGMYLLGRPGSPNQQVLITALMVYATAVPGYPLARLEETLVGIAVVVLLGPLLWPPDPYRSATEGLDGYRTAVRELLAGITRGLERGTEAVGAVAPAALPERAGLWLRPQACRDAFDRAAAGRSLLRRRAGSPPEGLDGRLVLASRTALTLQYFTQELGERTRGGGGAARPPPPPPRAPPPAPAARRPPRGGAP